MVIWFIRNGLLVTYATKTRGKHHKLITVTLQPYDHVISMKQFTRVEKVGIYEDFE